MLSAWRWSPDVRFLVSVDPFRSAESRRRLAHGRLSQAFVATAGKTKFEITRLIVYLFYTQTMLYIINENVRHLVHDAVGKRR